jgi:NTE family protein
MIAVIIISLGRDFFMQHRYANLVLSGGGIRGIAYAGVFTSAEYNKVKFRNIAGVSAGSIAGSLAAAGYNAREILKLMETCEFGDFKITEVSKKIPAVMRLYDYSRYSKVAPQELIDRFLQVPSFTNYSGRNLIDFENRGLFSNIITYSKEGCLFDGDSLEEWVYKCLKARGVETFEDLKSGAKDKVNPNGYNMRMTAVDADRKKIIVLPDDLAYYGYDPDKFKVATAVRMSCSVPFAFKPVVLVSNNQKTRRTYHIVDGGVLDNFPSWIIEDTKVLPTVGFKLNGGPKKILSLDTPLSIYKSLLMAVHDVGLPSEKKEPQFLGEVDCSSVGFLDMDLDDEQKRILIINGRAIGDRVFRKFRSAYVPKYYFFPIIQYRRRSKKLFG